MSDFDIKLPDGRVLKQSLIKFNRIPKRNPWLKKIQSRLSAYATQNLKTNW